MDAVLLVNFGGPRSLDEVAPFLKELLCDQEVIRTNFPSFLHRILFTRVANKRAKVISHDYEKIGGKSPIYEDTVAIAALLEKELGCPVIPFHRYLSATHSEFLSRVNALKAKEIRVFPLFPQFSYATTGSCALWMQEKLPQELLNRLHWVLSYADHPAYVAAKQAVIREFMQEKGIAEEEALLFFSAHGLPQTFVSGGDIYQRECERSYGAIKAAFPQAKALLAYQSKFGKGEWLRPYTSEVCEDLKGFEKKHVLFIPLSFPSDHIETLFEIEEQYLPPVRQQGLEAWRVPALNRRTDWMDAIQEILKSEQSLLANQMLLRKE